MDRETIEKAAYEESHNLDFQFIPWSNEKVARFTVEQINAALENAADIADGKGWTITGEEIRALKIP